MGRFKSSSRGLEESQWGAIPDRFLEVMSGKFGYLLRVSSPVPMEYNAEEYYIKEGSNYEKFRAKNGCPTVMFSSGRGVKNSFLEVEKEMKRGRRLWAATVLVQRRMSALNGSAIQ